MTRTMSDEEIVRNYREAKDKKKQVGILADLNVCKPEEIIEILKRGGVPHYALPRKSSPRLVEPKQEQQMQEKPKQEPTRAPVAAAGPKPVTPYKIYVEERLRELIRGIRDFAEAREPIDPEWIEEYNFTIKQAKK